MGLRRLDERGVPCHGEQSSSGAEGADPSGKARHGPRYPFNPVTTIDYELPGPTVVDLRVYDVAGKLIRVLENGVSRSAGRHQVLWHGCDNAGCSVPSGIYFYELESQGYRQIRKLVVIR
jgi:hypothetical protein